MIIVWCFRTPTLLFMLSKKNWNVRGLNVRARRLAIRSLLDTLDVSIVFFQEIKVELLCSSIVLEALGSEFDDYTYLLVAGSHAWRHSACVEEQGGDNHRPTVHHKCNHGESVHSHGHSDTMVAHRRLRIARGRR